MTNDIKVTKKLMSTLEWFKLNQPVESFNEKEGPSLRYTKKLVKIGLIEAHKELIPHPKFNGGIARYSLTKIGISILKRR